VAHHPEAISLVNSIEAGGDGVEMPEANTEESIDGIMVEILWHCRETRQQTEKTNIDLRFCHGEIPEGLSGSLAPGMQEEKRRELGRPHRLLVEEDGMWILRHRRGNPETDLSQSLSTAYRESHSDREGREADSWWGVRPAHSTLSTGEPCTWGRGRQSYAADKGNFIRTCRTGP